MKLEVSFFTRLIEQKRPTLVSVCPTHTIIQSRNGARTVWAQPPNRIWHLSTPATSSFSFSDAPLSFYLCRLRCSFLGCSF